MIVAIDGTVCSGKSTIARKLARRVGFTYLNTGAIYRAMTIKILENNKQNCSEDEIVKFVIQSDIQMHGDKEGNLIVTLDGVDVSNKINQPLISQNVATFAKIGRLREFAKTIQRRIASTADCVVEGRDIGTVVFPNAELKIFMTADDDVRTNRRLNDYKKMGKEMSYDDVKAEILARDKADMEREISPLKPCKDSVMYYNNGSDIEKVLKDLESLIYSRINIK